MSLTLDEHKKSVNDMSVCALKISTFYDFSIQQRKFGLTLTEVEPGYSWMVLTVMQNRTHVCLYLLWALLIFGPT